MRITRWDAAANDAYLRLFNVDMDQARRGRLARALARAGLTLLFTQSSSSRKSVGAFQ